MNLLTATTEALDSLTAVANWFQAHLPESQSTRSVHLFLALSNAVRLNRTITVAALERCGVLRHDPLSERLLASYKRAGLIAETRTGPKPEQTTLQPTQHFVALMLAFEHWHESTWIPRKRLHRRLHLAGLGETQAQLVRTVFDEFIDCDYLHVYGSCCVLMSSLLAEAFRQKGVSAKVVPSCVHISDTANQSEFLLGHQGIRGHIRQVDAHAVCVVDDALLVDFGMGSALRSYRPDLPWAIACPVDDRFAPIMAETFVAQSLRFQWLSEGFGTDIFAEIERTAGLTTSIFQTYKARFTQSPGTTRNTSSGS